MPQEGKKRKYERIQRESRGLEEKRGEFWREKS